MNTRHSRLVVLASLIFAAVWWHSRTPKPTVLAFRLGQTFEQVARDFPHNIIIGPGAVERAQRHRFLALGERLLRGKEKTTPLYTLDTSKGQAAAPQPASAQQAASSVTGVAGPSA